MFFFAAQAMSVPAKNPRRKLSTHWNNIEDVTETEINVKSTGSQGKVACGMCIMFHTYYCFVFKAVE